MLHKNVKHIVEPGRNTYGFTFENASSLNQIATIYGIGQETKQNTHNYRWNCLQRNDTETFILQYTLDGIGALTIDGTTHTLKKGNAFFIAVPENCEYYLPETSEKWKFFYITLQGSEVSKCWKYINENYGHVFNIPPEKRIIQHALTTYAMVKSDKQLNPYFLSNQAYELLTYCYQDFEELTVPESPSSDINAVLSYLHTHYTRDLSMLEVSEYIGLSKSYLSNKFKAEMGLPLINYLNKYRIEKATGLLISSDKPVKEIARELGFSDSNYFCKVFSKLTGTSPMTYRKSKN